MTNLALNSKNLIPNIVLKKLITDFEDLNLK
jgi:hypothetical protein